MNYITQNVSRSQDDAQFDQQPQFPQQESLSPSQRDAEGEENLIEMYTVNLNANVAYVVLCWRVCKGVMVHAGVYNVCICVYV